jgi:RHS repeat-associated protein
LTAKLIRDNGNIVAREFINYDSFNVIEKTISDDGSATDPNLLNGVTTRLITYYQTRQLAPAIGLPEVITECYLDPVSGTECLLGRKINHYTIEGRLASQQVFDANSTLAYILEWQYDQMGNVIQERNALGQLISRRFDANGNKIYEQGPSTDHHLEYIYDLANRLTAEICVCSDGQAFTKYYRYDNCSQLVATVDISGNETNYEYDDLGRLTKTYLPSCFNPDGDPVRYAIEQKYDIAGNLSTVIDTNGSITRTRYNIRAQPTHIQYPDGTAESKEYNLDGRLRLHVGKNGSYTQFHYDALSNVIRKETFSQDNQLQTATSATYKGALVTSETDGNGNITHYSYDGAGRLVHIQKSEGWTHFEYDALNRKNKTIQWIGPQKSDVKITIHDFDLLNRITEERIEDGFGNLFNRVNFEYDPQGNRSAITTYSNTGSSTLRTQYNCFGKPIRIINAEGDETLIHYSYKDKLEVTIVDALGRQTITTHDALGNPALTIKKDPYGEICSHTELQFNSKRNPIRRIDTVKTPNIPDRSVITEWQYDTLGRVVVLHEAVGTPLLRQTYYSYNTLGQKESEILPGGTILRYTYDALGRLAQHTSSDGSIDYQYSYDANNNLLSVFDATNSETTSRCYDNANRMISESLANGLSLSYQYDGLNRITKVFLPDTTSIGYQLTPTNLSEVNRIDVSNTTTYTHRYVERDPSGRLTKAQMIGNGGDIDYCWDKLGRLTHSSHNFFEEQVPPGGYDPVGNMTFKTRRDPLDAASCQFAFDPLNQLTDETGVASHDYSYDSIHNRVRKDGSECIVDTLNRLTQQGDTHYGYDLRGNRISSGENRYSYDALGRLTEAETSTGEKFQYRYDPFNRRISKKGVETTYYLYINQMEIGAADNNGTIHQLRILGQGKGAEIGASIAIEIEGNVYAPLHDHSGNITVLLSADTGQVVEFYRHTMFGEETTYPEGPSVINPWRFASKRHDPETGWIQFGQRYYDPQTARWTTPDPIGFQDGPNLYAYVCNSPIAHMDPTGLHKETCPRCGRPLNHDGRCSRCDNGYSNRGHERLAIIRNLACKAIAETVFHLCPIRAVQRGVADLASKICGIPMLEGYFEHSQVVTHHGTNENRSPIVLYNGILTLFSQFVPRLEEVSKANGNCTVIGSYNATHGLVGDLIECGLTMLGINTHAVEVGKQAIAEGFAANRTGNGIIALAHSQGGLTLHRSYTQFDVKMINKIYSVTCGSAKIICDPRLAGCANLVDKKEVVTLAGDPTSYIKACCGNSRTNVEWIGDLWGLPGSNHAFDIYQKAVFNHTRLANSILSSKG